MNTTTAGHLEEVLSNSAANYENINLDSEDIITIDSQIDLKVRGGLPESDILNAATGFMERRMKSFLEIEYGDFKLPQTKFFDSDAEDSIDDERTLAFDILKKFHSGKLASIADTRAKAHQRNKFLFSIEPGFEIIIPPYDTEWTNNFISFSNANKISGTFKSFPISNGYGASGLGVFLTPTADVSMRFSAHCPVSYSWSNLINDGGGYAASRGGLGITIYNATSKILVRDNQEVLWNQSKRPSGLEVSGGSDDLYLQGTSLGQSYFNMKEGSTYLIWIWCWAFADSGPNAAAFANIECKVPFMIVDSSTI